MKTTLLLLLSFTLLCFTAPQPTTKVLHQPDFTQAQFYSWDSIFVVEEFNTGSAHTLAPGESFFDHCDYMGCADSIATWWKIKGKNKDVTSYARRTTGYWTIYFNGVATGKAAVETGELVHTEMVESWEDATGDVYVLRMEYYKTKVIDDIKRKIAHDDRKYATPKITKGDAQLDD